VSAPATQVRQDWRLVAPWWHWPLAAGSNAGDRAAVRSTAPIFQKYDSPDLVNLFLADPQLRLQFTPDADQVATVTGGGPRLGGYPTRTLTGRRKLYLGSHHRHYLVVCSLHCDTPGFPSVARTGVCEAGFIVRRRTTNLEKKEQAQATTTLRAWSRARARREGAQAQLAAARVAGTAGALRQAAIEARLAAAAKAEDTALSAARAWAQQVSVRRGLEGWVPQGVRPDGTVTAMPPCGRRDEPGAPSPLAGVGAWQAAPELSGDLDEATFPLYPLVAGGGLPADAVGEAVWFGVVPTGSSDVDPTGAARFDDQHVYEIRCYVRHHRPECTRSHCQCPIIWSEPTEGFQLASHFDLQGTANRPVTVQMPDLAQLQADALRLGPGAGGVRFHYPAGSTLPMTTNNLDATEGADGGSQICSFSIPLITIVATFVFSLFLPILVFVFQLWFLLMLKFCIPPSISVSAGLDAALTALGGGLEIDATVAASLSPNAPANPLNTELDALMTGQLQHNVFRDNKSLAQRVKGAVTGGKLDERMWAGLARSVVARKPSGATDRVFAPRVRRDEVVEP
jgi:hypothetical protein